MRFPPAAPAALAAAVWAGAVGATHATRPADAEPARGAVLYAGHCASCHGATLEGQPDWRQPRPDGTLPAPPHDETGHTWHHGDALLFSYTKFGGEAALAARGVEFPSAMPGFAGVLSDREIWDILAFIRSRWPERIRQVQELRTEAEAQAPH